MLCLVVQGGFANVVVNRIIPGTKKLNITFLDSIEKPDLSQVEVENNIVENAVFIENKDRKLPTQLNSKAIDLTTHTYANISHYNRNTGELHIEGPINYSWFPGQLIVDTAYSGVMLEVLTVEELDRLGNHSKWKMKTKPAQLLDVIHQCDLFFLNQSFLNSHLADTQWVDSTTQRYSAFGSKPSRFSVFLRGTSIQGSPVVQGRLRIVDGKIEIFKINVEGSIEIESNISTYMTDSGHLNMIKKVPVVINHQIPIDRGLVIDLGYTFYMKLDVISKGRFFNKSINMAITQELNASFNFDDAKGWEMGNFQFVSLQNGSRDSNPLNQISGNSYFSLVPKLTLGLMGSRPLKVEMESYLRTFYSRNFLRSINQFQNIGGLIALHHDTGMVLTRAFERSISTPPISRVPLEERKAFSDSVYLDWFHYPEIQKYVLQKHTSKGWHDLDTVAQGPVTVYDVLPSTEYIFRLIPINDFGVGIPEIAEVLTPARNFAPTVAQLIYPMNQSTHQGEKVELTWESKDPENDPLTSIIYLDTKNPPETHFSVQGFSSIQNLKPGVYYWNIRMKDGDKESVSSVQSFKVSAKKITPKIITDTKRGNVVFIPEGVLHLSQQTKVNAFYLHQYEVVQKDFQKIIGKNPSFRKGSQLPVENVTWIEARKYCHELDGRLPTETEWEYSIRANTSTDYYWKGKNINDFAWYFENSKNQTHPVGKKKPNAWGLYDMSGNVFEWVEDWYNPVKVESELNRAKVTRGGSWYSDPKSLKSSARFKNRPGFSSFKLGFRCAFDKAVIDSGDDRLGKLNKVEQKPVNSTNQ